MIDQVEDGQLWEELLLTKEVLSDRTVISFDRVGIKFSFTFISIHRLFC